MWRSVFFVKTSGKSSGILLNITLHKKCFLALFSYNNDSINIGKKSKCCLYIEMGLHWQAYQMDVNLRRTSNLYKNHEKMFSKQREKGGQQGRFTYNYIFDAFCDLKLLASSQNFKSTSMGVSFLIKLHVFNCSCNEKILLLRCFWGFAFRLMISNRKTHRMMSFVSAFFTINFIFF